MAPLLGDRSGRGRAARVKRATLESFAAGSPLAVEARLCGERERAASRAGEAALSWAVTSR